MTWFVDLCILKTRRLAKVFFPLVRRKVSFCPAQVEEKGGKSLLKKVVGHEIPWLRASQQQQRSKATKSLAQVVDKCMHFSVNRWTHGAVQKDY